jgi:hypothetical protein
MKGKVYKNNPRTAEALKTEIRNIVLSINGDELPRVFRNLMTRCEAQIISSIFCDLGYVS